MGEVGGLCTKRTFASGWAHGESITVTYWDLLPCWLLSMTRCGEPSLQCSVETKFMIFLGSLLQEDGKQKNLVLPGCYKVRYWSAPGSLNSTYSAARYLLCPLFLVQFVSNMFFWSHPVATCELAQGSTATMCWGWGGVKCFGVLKKGGCCVHGELPIALGLVICCG